MEVKILRNDKEFACISYIFGDTMIDAGVVPNLPKGVIKKLVLTHAHFDHVLYANEVKRKYGVKIYASKRCSEHLKKVDEVVKLGLKLDLKPIDVDVIVKDGDKIGDLIVIETPGHTDGSICLFYPKEKILFSGDTLFRDGVGRTDLPTGDEKKLMQSIKKLLKLNPRLIFAGH